jgi:hypothetical protein
MAQALRRGNHPIRVAPVTPGWVTWTESVPLDERYGGAPSPDASAPDDLAGPCFTDLIVGVE